MTRAIRVDSTEYVKVTLTADHDITADTIEISLDGGGTWHSAEHVTGGVRILVGPAASLPLAAGMRAVLLRIYDSPEVPVISAGSLVVLAT